MILEIKDAEKVHTIKGADLDAVFRRAAQMGKSAEYVVYFVNANITLTGRLTRGKG